jgi:hydroxymethylglutaryl-CoA lyase
MTRLPETARIVEVGPRDGLQNQPRTVPTEAKAEFIRLLGEAGIEDIEVTSFVRPDRVPQLADAEQLIPLLPPGPRYTALVPNLVGLERAVEAGLSRIAVFTAASETFNRKNINMSVEESLEAFRAILRRARDHRLWVRGYVSTVWVCPYEGAIAKEKVKEVVMRLVDLGVAEISLGDTIGAATPRDVEDTLGLLIEEVPRNRLAMHFHDTYGLALANAYQALTMGFSIFDSSAGGLGGCPYAPGALGNVATEDLLYLLDRLDIRTGVSLGGVRRASEFMARQLERTLPSRILGTPAGTEPNR